MLEFILGFLIGCGFGFVVFYVLNASRRGEDLPNRQISETDEENA